MLVTGALLLLSVLLLATLLIWRRWHFSYFERIGIPGPKPSLIWGNLKEYHSMQYGDIFGFYNGDAPFVVSRDINFVEHIFVRDFQNFVDRGFTMMTDQMHPDLKKSIMHIGGSAWKSIRSSVTYGMSANKLKQMMPHLKEDADIFVKSLEKHADTGEKKCTCFANWRSSPWITWHEDHSALTIAFKGILATLSLSSPRPP
ncbi:hypothetical protein MRX96_022459 [Rhipicephalus microplus]